MSDDKILTTYRENGIIIKTSTELDVIELLEPVKTPYNIYFPVDCCINQCDGELTQEVNVESINSIRFRQDYIQNVVNSIYEDILQHPETTLLNILDKE